MTDDEKRLERVFGIKSQGNTPSERAKTSDMLFVRSQDELSLFREGAKGRQLSAWEAFDTFGFELLEEAVCEGAAIIVHSEDEPARTFKERRISLGLSTDDIADALQLDETQIDDIENSHKRNPIRILELVAQHLGLDERKITFKRDLQGDADLALRLKDYKTTYTLLSSKTVLSFTEAAWIIAVEDRLQELLGTKKKINFDPSDEYGDAYHPAFKIAYDLAHETRKKLGLSQDEPILSLRELCIDKLSLPVVQCKLPLSIAAATIANNKSRGIVVNTDGKNQNVWVQRATVAHELGHLLWDPDQKLRKISVDNYKDIESGWSIHQERGSEFVEQRANAFAAEFLAPMEIAESIYRKEGIRTVMEKFGVSFFLARYQIWNATYRTENLESITVDNTEETQEWSAREFYTVDWFPIKSVPISRRGYFAGLVRSAEKKNLISKDTAVQYLHCSEDEYSANKESIEDIYPIKV